MIVESLAAELGRYPDEGGIVARNANPLITAVLVATLATCSSAPLAPIQSVSPDLLNSPNQLVVDNATLRLDIYPYRDFQPGTEVDTRMIAGFRLVVSGGPFPAGLRAEKAWLVRGDEAWVSVPNPQPQTSTPNQVEYVSRKGPQWPVGDLVVGVVQLRDARNNSYLLRSASQPIGRTD